MCFRFYDPILALIKEEASSITRHYFNLKNQLNVQRMKDDADLKLKIARLFGVEKLFKFERLYP